MRRDCFFWIIWPVSELFLGIQVPALPFSSCNQHCGLRLPYSHLPSVGEAASGVVDSQMASIIQ